MKGFATKAIHGVTVKKDVHGSLRMPVYDSVAFEVETSRDLELSFQGRKPAHAYSRISNPTVEDFEQRVGLLTGAAGVAASASGMAAIATLMMAIGEAGSNVVTSRFLFGNTLSLFQQTLGDWGLETRLAGMTRPESVAEAIDAKTRAVFLEAISNPQLEVADTKKIAEIAHSHGVPLIVDGTLTTPYLFLSKNFGADLEVLSSTKYLSGGATSVGGLLIDHGTFDWSQCPKLRKDATRYGPYVLLMKLRREVSRNVGACLSPHNAYLQTLGLETLALRVDKSCSNALVLARFLEKQPHVRSVNYPGLPHSPFYAIAKEQFSNRFGALLTFELKTKEECFRFMDSLRIIRRAANLNDNKTLIVHPASTIFCDYSEEEKRDMHVRETMIRLSVGIEDVDDIIDDMTRGFGQL